MSGGIGNERSQFDEPANRWEAAAVQYSSPTAILRNEANWPGPGGRTSALRTGSYDESDGLGGWGEQSQFAAKRQARMVAGRWPRGHTNVRNEANWSGVAGSVTPYRKRGYADSAGCRGAEKPSQFEADDTEMQTSGGDARPTKTSCSRPQTEASGGPTMADRRG